MKNKEKLINELKETWNKELMEIIDEIEDLSSDTVSKDHIVAIIGRHIEE